MRSSYKAHEDPPPWQSVAKVSFLATFPKQGTRQPDSHIKLLTEVQSNINAMTQRAATDVLLSLATSVPGLSSVRRDLALCLALSLALQTEAEAARPRISKHARRLTVISRASRPAWRSFSLSIYLRVVSPSLLSHLLPLPPFCRNNAF